MGIVLDIILIIIVVLPIVIGLRRGMVGTLMGFISVVLALIIARVAVPYIQPVAQEKLVTVYVHEPLGEYIASELQTEGGGAVASVAELLDKLGLADLDIDGDSGNEGFAAAVTAAAESRISEGIAFLGSFLLALIAMRIITAVLEAVFRLPVLHGVNKLAGGALGAVTLVFVVLCQDKLDDIHRGNSEKEHETEQENENDQHIGRGPPKQRQQHGTHGGTQNAALPEEGGGAGE